MFATPSLIIHVAFFLLTGAILCLLLEIAGSPEGIRKSGQKPHISLVALLSLLGAVFYFLQAPRLNLPLFWGTLDPLARISVFLSAMPVVSSFSLAIPQMRHISQERGECYALILISFLLSIILCVSHEILYFAISAFLWLLLHIIFLFFRGSRQITSTLGIKMVLYAGFWFILMALCLALHMGAPSKIYLIFAWIGVLTFMGATPFFWFHTAYLEGAPSFAALSFASGTLIGTGTFVVRLFQITHNSGLFTSSLQNLLLCIAGLSLLIPPILALDQRKIGPMCIYLILTSPGIILATAISSYSELSLVLLFSNLAIALPGVIGGLHFWKQAANAQKTWEDYAGAGRKHPLIASAWLLLMSSLVGIPGTLGFAIRIHLIENSFHQHNFILGHALWIAIILGAAPIARLGIFMFAKPTQYELNKYHRPRQTYLIITCAALILVGGLVPQILASQMLELFQ